MIEGKLWQPFCDRRQASFPAAGILWLHSLHYVSIPRVLAGLTRLKASDLTQYNQS